MHLLRFYSRILKVFYVLKENFKWFFQLLYAISTFLSGYVVLFSHRIFFSFRQEVAQPSNTGVGKLPVFIFVFLFDII